ncbi:hypothetical protein SETIT_1G137700v2 [Setaria italica]|uniref:Uncharacterized protein n=1 Tax=Setaria italica TaxID=4555 RepID=K3YUL2_SETIT|nr:uncharacterized protein LOC101774632 [Setaria italica]RCV06113.1 hypothetical protein SETIT_1G137700v2 [Setaria italica]RCV06114.1 hypothetical protein SETIT_1G137700v2 [Setaria italica]RCV06115.1 hypothetical protein SETIT_1G137700v2 [Setaria italica]
MTVDAALLAAVVAFLLPLRLISLALRLAYKGCGASGRHLRRSCAALAVAGALLAVIFALPRDRAGECAVPGTTVIDGEELRSEVEQLKLQLARLESLWDNNLKALNEKGDTLEKVLGKKGDPLEEEDGRVMRAMGLDIQSLINEQENIKESSCSSDFGDNIKAMEDEVRLIKDESSKMNSDIHSVWALAKDATEKVEALHSDIKKGQVLTDEWGKMNSSINRLWSFVKGTEKKVEGLCSDIKKVQHITGEWGKMNFNRMWSFAKDTEKKVEDLYSDIKKGFKQTKRKVPFMRT